MADLDLKREDEIDKRYNDRFNPSTARNLASNEQSTGIQAGIDQLEAFANDPNNASTLADKEEEGFYKGSGTGSTKKAPVTLKSTLRKRGPIMAIGGILLGGGFGMSVLFSPALLITHFKESLTDKYNDQLAAMDMRSTAIMKKKLGKTTLKGKCGVVTIRCKYQTIGKRQLKRLQAAGFTIEGDRSLVTGRLKPTTFQLGDGDPIKASDMIKLSRRDPALRSALQHGYNPKFAAFSDHIAAKTRAKLGIKKTKTSLGNTDKEVREKLSSISGEGDKPDTDGQKLTKKETEDGKTYYLDEKNGVEYSEEEGKKINNLLDEEIGRAGLADSVGKSAIKSTLKGALTSTALGFGAVDSACTVWTTIRVAGFAAKIYGQRQLIRYSYEFIKTGDEIKAGEATPEQVEKLGNILTSVNSQGRSATDSDGYRYAAYGDLFKAGSFDSDIGDGSDKELDRVNKSNELKNETSRYVSGQIIPDNAMSSIIRAVGAGGGGTKAADSTCKFVKSWKGQTILVGLAVVGAVVAFFSGGTSAVGGAAAQAAVSIAASVAIAALIPVLQDMAKGKLITGEENGNQAGNAITSGMGGFNAQSSQGRGLAVLNKDDALAYANETSRILASYAEVERVENSPFDITSKYTFVGSIANTLLPYASKMKTSGSFTTSTLSLIGNTFGSLTKSPTNAASKKDEFGQCSDPEYKDSDLAADPFCNLRYGLKASDLNADPETILENMIAGGYITEEDATPQGDYADYIKKCIERENSIGDSLSSGDEGDGSDCIQGKNSSEEKRNAMFRVFYIDQSINDGMETYNESEVAEEAAAELSGGATINIASFNVRGASHDGDGGTLPYAERMVRTVETIKHEAFDVIGFQEFETPQRTEFKKLLSDYELSSDNSGEDNGNAIGWNTSKYTLIEKGTMPNLLYTTGNKLKAPWVKLKDNSTNQEFYLANTHDPANVHDSKPTRNAARRSDNAKQHVKFMNEKAGNGTPVFMTGDFNSTFSANGDDPDLTEANRAERQPYCIMTKAGIANAFDLYKNRQVKCPNQNIDWKKIDPGKGCSTNIDHLYVDNAGLSVSIPNFGCVRKGDQKKNLATGNGSDHDTVKFTAVIPGVDTGSGGGSTFTVSTYNQKNNLGATQFSGAVDNMIKLKMDIVGTQESTNPKYSAYKKQLSKANYGVFPDRDYSDRGYVNQSCSYAQSIFYNKDKFSFLKGEVFQIPRYPSKAQDCGDGEKSTKGTISNDSLPDIWTNAPILWLKDNATGQVVIVMNTHNVANVKIAQGTRPAKSRAVSADIYIQQVTRLKAENPGVPIVMTGDFNEGSQIRQSGNVTLDKDYKNLLFCKFAETKLMKSVTGPDMKCPSDKGSTVDFIYITPEIKVDWTKTIASGGGNSGPPSYSDHSVKYAQLTVPGSGTSSGSLSWPVDKKYFDTNKADFLGAHSASTGTSWGNGNWGKIGVSSKGPHMASDIGSPPDGSPVYAMLSGKVFSTNLCGDGDGVAIMSTVNGKKVAISYMHGDNQTVKVGDNVKSGQKIMNLGEIGCTVRGGHVHIGIVYDGNYLCPQDVFIALNNNKQPDWDNLITKAVAPCGRM